MWFTHYNLLGFIDGATATEEEVVQTSGGTVRTRRKRKPLTDEEVKGLIQYGKAVEASRQQEIEKSIVQSEPIVPILEERKTKGLSEEITKGSLAEFELPTLQEKLEPEDDIGLILAIIEAHLN